MESVVEKLKRYAALDTQSDADSESCPSTEGQWLLARMLKQEMEACFAEALHYADLADVSREEVHELLRLVEEDHDGSNLSSERGKEI